MNTCPFCGAAVGDEDRFCCGCGNRMPGQSPGSAAGAFPSVAPTQTAEMPRRSPAVEIIPESPPVVGATFASPAAEPAPPVGMTSGWHNGFTTAPQTKFGGPAGATAAYPSRQEGAIAPPKSAFFSAKGRILAISGAAVLALAAAVVLIIALTSNGGGEPITAFEDFSPAYQSLIEQRLNEEGRADLELHQRSNPMDEYSVPCLDYSIVADKSFTGFMSACECDFFGDGETELICVSTSQTADGFEEYADANFVYCLSLTSYRQQNGRAELIAESEARIDVNSYNTARVRVMIVNKDDRAFLCVAVNSSGVPVEYSYQELTVYELSSSGFTKVISFESTHGSDLSLRISENQIEELYDLEDHYDEITEQSVYPGLTDARAELYARMDEYGAKSLVHTGDDFLYQIEPLSLLDDPALQQACALLCGFSSYGQYSDDQTSYTSYLRQDDFTGMPGEEKTGEPEFVSMAACVAAIVDSGHLNDQNGRSYGPWTTADGDPDTVWISNTEEDGAAGAWIMYSFDGIYTLHGLKMINGNVYKDGYYYRNGHIREFLLEFSDGSSLLLTAREIESRSVEDNVFYFDKPVVSSFVKLTVISSYIGTKSEYRTNTALAELVIF